MKKISRFFLALAMAAGLSGCHYLDVDSELGLTEGATIKLTRVRAKQQDDETIPKEKSK